jgi:uncharacterized protein (DUF952 family)
MPESPLGDLNRVFKILQSDQWANAAATGFYYGSDDDLRDGYIHLSSATQIEGTLKKYFRAQPGLLLVAYESATLTPHLKWEASRGGDLFPHYYGPLPTELALWQRPLPLGADGIPVFEKDNL